MSFINISKRSLTIFIVILIVAIYLRFQGVFTNSFPFTYDIGRDLLKAQEIVTTFKLPLIGATTGINGFFYGPWWYYFLSLLYYPLQGNPTYFTGFIAFLGVGVVLLSFVIGKKIGNSYFALILASLLAVSNQIVGLTSQVWNPDLIPIFWILSFLCIYYIYEKKQLLLNFLLLGFLLGLLIDTEIIVGILYAVGVMIALLATTPKTLKVKNTSFGILGFIIILLPRIIFDFRHQHILSKTLIKGLTSFSSNGTATSVTPIPQKIDAIFALFSSTLANDNKTVGAIILALVILIIFLFYKKGSHKAQFFAKLSLIIIFTTILGLVFLGHDIWGHYFYILPLLFIFIASLSLYFLYQDKKFKYLAVLLAIVLIVFNLNIPQRIESFKNPYFTGNASVYRNQLQVVDYVYQESSSKKFKFIVYTPPVIDYTYRYLFDWRGQTKYHKIPTQKGASLLFVILEPDIEMPQRQVDWLKLRDNDGKIILTKKFESGIIVQTRIVH